MVSYAMAPCYSEASAISADLFDARESEEATYMWGETDGGFLKSWYPKKDGLCV